MHIDELIQLTKNQEASDLILTAGVPPILRIDKKLVFTQLPALSPAQIDELLTPIMDEQKREKFLGDAWRAFSFFKGKETSAIITTDNRLLYFFPETKISQKIPQTLDDLKGYNYFLFSPWAEIASQREGLNFKGSGVRQKLNDKNLFLGVFESGEYLIYEIRN